MAMQAELEAVKIQPFQAALLFTFFHYPRRYHPLLSYRHSYHAGNFADVLKHLIAVEVFEHLLKKDKPFDYIDTHAGAGLFNLTSGHASKLAEYKGGVGKLSEEEFPELYMRASSINSCNAVESFTANSLRYYPGSPAIAKYFLRRKDRGWLYELHPNDSELLTANMGAQKNIRVKHEDGLSGLKSLLPPVSRRAFVLMDPSYEVKSDYDRVVSVLEDAYARFPTGTYALWYPVVERSRIERLEKKLANGDIKNIQRFELAIAADNNERGMTAAGLFVINPPWTLFEKMNSVLPRLAALMGNGERLYKCDVLVPE